MHQLRNGKVHEKLLLISVHSSSLATYDLAAETVQIVELRFIHGGPKAGIE
jgi:hypothetical protein